MLTTAMLRSEVFDRLTGRKAPKLVYPTAKRFDFAVWRAALKGGGNYSARDLHLVRAARYIGASLDGIRRDLVDGLFEGMTPDQVIELAIANANRGWNIVRWKLKESLELGNSNSTRFIAALGQEGLPIGPDGTLVNPDDAINAITDGLPYWFSEAVGLKGEGRVLNTEDAHEIMHRGHIATNLMQTFKAIWLEVLWEPWSFENDEDGAEIAPLEPEGLARWRAWEWREMAAIGQASLLNRNLEKDMKDVALAIPLTATAISAGGVEIGRPDDTTAAAHRSAFDNLQKTYAAVFLNQPIGTRDDVTPVILESVVCVLQDLVSLRLRRDADPKDLDQGDPLAFACSFQRDHLVTLIVNALGLGNVLASACLDEITCDPFGPLGDLFNVGLWHRPLVRSSDGSKIMIAAGALCWGSPIRRVERWLQEGGDNDLSKTPAGIRYESALREALASAITGNEIFTDAITAVTSIPRGQADEEIDLLLRIDGTIVVGEIKCLLGASEPIERHNYLSKLEAACSQASRKAQWLDANRPELVARLGEGAEGCRLQPLVVVNQSAGIEWEYEGCPITDARFLELFLSAGKFVFGGMMYSEPGRAPVLVSRKMYGTAAEAEQAIPNIFKSTPVMDPFRDSITWSNHDMPMPGGVRFRLAVPRRDPDAYTTAMQKLIADANI